MPAIRILFMADTHLGLDLPFRPRVQRRRRGEDFFANYRRALVAARTQGVDAIIHGGDLFNRSRVPRQLVETVFDPLKAVAASGIPVFIVPGNHERSMIPHSELSLHPKLKVFTRPATFVIEKGCKALALSGFPFVRNRIRSRFKAVVEATQWRRTPADGHLLCMHQSVQGSTVGPADFTFKDGEEVIRARDVPRGFAAILSGHIHRFQVLRADLGGTPLPAPVFYPGAIERVSFAERNERKGYLLLTIELGAAFHQPRVTWRFQPLPTRPMVLVRLRPAAMDHSALNDHLRASLAGLPADAVVRLELIGRVPEAHRASLSANALRALASPSMTIETIWEDCRTESGHRQSRS